MKVLFIIIFCEYCLILIVGILMCLLKGYFAFREQKTRQEVALLKKEIKEAIVMHKSAEEFWRKSKTSVSLLLYVLETFDANILDEHWIKIKAYLADKILLPWARQHARSFFWGSRMRSARAFLLYPLAQDIPFIQHFLYDSSFFIRMLAVDAFNKIPSPEIIELLLKRMAKETTAARFPYRHSLLNMPLEYQLHIIDVYEKAEEESLRLVCLDLLSRRILGRKLWVIKKDYTSKNTQVRIFVVRILGNLAQEEAVQDLMSFLEDSEADVRREALVSLAKLRSEKSFEKVASLLHDPDYRVRLQAAFTLHQFGKKGMQLLEMQDWDIDPQAYEVARYVLTMP